MSQIIVQVVARPIAGGVIIENVAYDPTEQTWEDATADLMHTVGEKLGVLATSPPPTGLAAQAVEQLARLRVAQS